MAERKSTLGDTSSETRAAGAKQKAPAPRSLEDDRHHDYGEIFNATHDAIFVHDAETGEIVDVNQRALELLQCSRDALTPMMVRDFSSGIEPYTWEGVLERIRRATTEGPQLFEWQVKRRDGELIWVEVALRCATLKGRQCVLAIARDVSERVEAQQTLEQHLQELTFLHSLGMRIASSLSLDDVIAFALDAMCDLLHPDVAMLFLRDGETLSLAGSRSQIGNVPSRAMRGHRVGECLCGLAVGQHTAIYSRNIHQDVRCTWDECKKTGLVSFCALPLKHGGDVLGVLGLASKSERDFAAQGPFLETVSNEVAIAIQNAVYHQQLTERTRALETEVREHERAKDALAESEEKYRRVVETSPEIIVLADLSGNVVYANREFARSHRLTSAEEWYGRSAHELIVEEQRDQAYDTMQRLLSGEQPGQQEFTFLRRDGTRFLASVTGNILRNEDGTPHSLMFVAEDITRRKQEETTLRENEQRLRILFEQAADAIYVSDVQGRLLRVNEAACRATGYSRQEISQLNVIDVDAEVNTAEAFIQLVSGLSPGTPQTIESRHCRKDGSTFPVEITIARLETPDGVRILGIARDISERRLAEDALRKSEQRLKTAVETMPVMVDAFDTHQNVIVWNRECERVTGYSAEEMIGNSQAMELLYPDPVYRNHVIATLRKESGDFRNLEFTLTCKNGESRVVSWSNISDSHPIADWSTWAIGIDTTERNHAERALRESEDRYRTVFEQTGEGILLVKDVIIDCNEAAARILQMAKHDIVGKTPAEFSPPTQEGGEQSAALQHEIWARVYAGEPQRFSWHCVRGDGKTIELDVQLRLITVGGDSAILATGRDITELREAERALRSSEELMRSVFLAAPVGIGVVSDRVFINVNDRFCEITGYTKDEVIGQRSRMLYPSDEEFAYVGREKYEQIAAKGTGTVETKFVRKDGDIIDVLLSSTPLDPKDLVAGVTFTALDITELKQAQRERESLINTLEAQNAELERFTYTVSHDLKSPLITIRGFVGMLAEDLAGADQQAVEDDLSRIASAADKMNRLLENLLELSRIGRLVNASEEVAFDSLVQEALDLLDTQITTRGVEVTVLADSSVQIGDRVRLLEVLQNLIDNATKYVGNQPHPRIEIGTRGEDDETVYYVKDNGLGIEATYHERIFGLFDQLDPRVDGTGIGLALVKRIVETHGGQIWVESEGPGKGSTFCYTIPAPSSR